MKIFIGADHRGQDLLNFLVQQLKEQGHEILKSSIPTDKDDDYPDFAFDIGQKVVKNPDSLGIVICGNGIGISIAANKVKGIRCARVTSIEDAHHAKNHNGANMIAFGGLDNSLALQIVQTFISTEKATEERHIRRIKKIMTYEQEETHER